jgi:hypothetical protein
MELSYNTTEEYRQLSGDRGFVSNYGNYKNKRGVQLQGTTNKGYLLVYTGKTQERIHRLVAEAFLPNPEGKEEVNHIDGFKNNNSVENLEWATHLENMQHAVRTGLHVLGFGENSRRAILDNKKVAYIRKNFIKRDHKFGLTGLGKMFGVTPTSISRVVTNKNWN